MLGALDAAWEGADLQEAVGETSAVADLVFGRFADRVLRREDPPAGEDDAFPPLHLLVRGTNFQIKVWEALLRVPTGSVTTYGDLAGAIGQPKSRRAVGSAVARNPICFLIPCHRVIRSTGEFGQYASGPERKRAILAWEAARLAG